MVTFWVLGAITIMFGAMIAGRLDRTLGVSDLSYSIALLMSFILFLLGGILWISVAVAVKHVSEE